MMPPADSFATTTVPAPWTPKNRMIRYQRMWVDAALSFVATQHRPKIASSKTSMEVVLNALFVLYAVLCALFRQTKVEFLSKLIQAANS